MHSLKKFTKTILRKGGRNHQGVITIRHRGGGNPKLYRIIDFKRSLFDVLGVVKKIESDPNRTSKIALICYQKGILSYILSPQNLRTGDFIQAGPSAEILIGNALPIGYIPLGTVVHNLELKPGHGGQFMRSAGTHARLIEKGKSSVQTSIFKLNSGKLYSIPLQCMATIGTVSHAKPTKVKKAGTSRWKGRRPKVRGVAMNPVDHPHGGGEGKSKGGRHPVTP